MTFFSVAKFISFFLFSQYGYRFLNRSFRDKIIHAKFDSRASYRENLNSHVKGNINQTGSLAMKHLLYAVIVKNTKKKSTCQNKIFSFGGLFTYRKFLSHCRTGNDSSPSIVRVGLSIHHSVQSVSLDALVQQRAARASSSSQKVSFRTRNCFKSIVQILCTSRWTHRKSSKRQDKFICKLAKILSPLSSKLVISPPLCLL